MDKEKIEFIQYVYKTFCHRGRKIYLLPNNIYQDLENYRTTMKTVAEDNHVTVDNVRQAWYLTKACEYARTEDSDVESKFFIHLMQIEALSPTATLLPSRSYPIYPSSQRPLVR